MSTNQSNNKSVSLISAKQMRHCYQGYLDTREPTDTVWYFNHTIGNIMVMNNKELREEMKAWRKQARAGKTVIRECNSKTVTVEGETYYMLVVQHEHQQDQIDPAGLLLLGEMVDGWVYCFLGAEPQQDPGIRNAGSVDLAP